MLFTAIIFVAVLYVGLYVTLSVPGVQRKVRDVACKQLSEFVGSKVNMGEVTINPFNEVVIYDLDLYEPGESDKLCLHVDKVGAGISIWNLIVNREIIITYAELIKLNADIYQASVDAPLNIQFLIDAFAPKDKNKPPTKFDLQIRNIVIRKSSASFNRLWLPYVRKDMIDFNHINLSGLNADVALPRLSNDRIEVDLRRLAFRVNSLLEVKRLSFLAIIDHGDISLKDFSLSLPNSLITLSDQDIPLGSRFNGDFKRMINELDFSVAVNGSKIVPAEFSGFYPSLVALQTPFTIALNATGNAHTINLTDLRLANPYEDFTLEIKDAIATKEDKNFSNLSVDKIMLHAGSSALTDIPTALLVNVNQKLINILNRAGTVDIEITGRGSIARQSGEAKVKFGSGYGNMDIDAQLISSANLLNVNAEVATEGINLGDIIDDGKLGLVAFNLNGEITIDRNIARSHRSTGVDVIDRINDLLPRGEVFLTVPRAEINGYPLHDLSLAVDKSHTSTSINLECDDENFNLALDGLLNPAGENSTLQLTGDLINVNPQVLFPVGKLGGYVYSSDLTVDVKGNRPDNILGSVTVEDFNAIPIKGGKTLKLSHLGITSTLGGNIEGESQEKRYIIDSDWIQGNISGQFLPTALPRVFKRLTSGLMPVGEGGISTPKVVGSMQRLDYDFIISRNGNWADFLNLPIKLLYNARINGCLEEQDNFMDLHVSAPYIRQGKDKLIQHSQLDAEVRDGKGMMSLFSSIPTKKGILDLDVDIVAKEGVFDIGLGFNKEKKGGFYGDFSLTAAISPALNQTGRSISAQIHPTTLWLNNAGWEIGEANLNYTDKKIEVTGFSVAHEDQYITIGGIASADPEQEMLVKLKDIDLDYIFDTLNIEYVAFGGLASGEAVGRGLLSKNPEAFTRRLSVKNLSYNHAVLGDGDLRGNFDAANKRVGIYANISEGNRHVANVDGGIWIGRDSLSFGIEADKVRIGFLQTFMQAFSSAVDGRASGKAQLYGTFKDIDMRGRLFADTISLLVDYTNVTYCGSDSVIIDPGRITIPSFRIHDRYGNSATLQGTLTHNYFHDPKFRFSINGARNLLVYDTDARMNPIWYGRIFGNGGGVIDGRPGYVGIFADMTTCPGSNFTFVLSDAQEALDYKFLTFTDKRKEAKEAENWVEPDETDEIVAAFNREVSAAVPESVFSMDIRATITPSVKLTLVMDPVAGDKITAYGGGAMNMTYNSESNDIRMYGKYTLEEGVYNFSLQDLILKDFIIKPGSSISFNGDPLNGLLDIRAAYRVNTNLTDLDKSFATDRDLNRTNVPVDAMLLVKGEMTQPDITFDIELPTLNDEVEQKVRSIISSEDMMNRQMIYLLALNRFYTPEYMGTTSGGEWASVASSTLSSQLTNMLGQLTDKVNIAPSVRSDKGDFSDVEVDLALSSRLFNNRLLINGNFGYRDRNTSTTTFIGDFDIEYLLHRNGNLRLKAYNHFNDQNYYLKSALTTQGVGIIYRKDFDRLFHRRKKKPLAEEVKSEGSDRSDKSDGSDRSE